MFAVRFLFVFFSLTVVFQNYVSAATFTKASALQALTLDTIKIPHSGLPKFESALDWAERELIDDDYLLVRLAELDRDLHAQQKAIVRSLDAAELGEVFANDFTRSFNRVAINRILEKIWKMILSSRSFDERGIQVLFSHRSLSQLTYLITAAVERPRDVPNATAWLLLQKTLESVRGSYQVELLTQLLGAMGKRGDLVIQREIDLLASHFDSAFVREEVAKVWPAFARRIFPNHREWDFDSHPDAVLDLLRATTEGDLRRFVVDYLAAYQFELAGKSTPVPTASMEFIERALSRPLLTTDDVWAAWYATLCVKSRLTAAHQFGISITTRILTVANSPLDESVDVVAKEALDEHLQKAVRTFGNYFGVRKEFEASLATFSVGSALSAINRLWLLREFGFNSKATQIAVARFPGDRRYGSAAMADFLLSTWRAPGAAKREYRKTLARLRQEGHGYNAYIFRQLTRRSSRFALFYGCVEWLKKAAAE